MRGINTVVIILIIIGANIIFLLTMFKIQKAMISFLIDIDKDTIINALGYLNFYSALSVGDFYYFGGIEPLNSKNFTLESDSKVLLEFLVGKSVINIDLYEGRLEAEPLAFSTAKYVFTFPKYGVTGRPFRKKLLPDVLSSFGGLMIPVIKGLGKGIAEYGYAGSINIIEAITDVCRTKAGKVLLIDTELSLQNISNMGISINGMPYYLKDIPCKIGKIDYEGYVKKLNISYSSPGEGEEWVYLEVIKK